MYVMFYYIVCICSVECILCLRICVCLVGNGDDDDADDAAYGGASFRTYSFNYDIHTGHIK